MRMMATESRSQGQVLLLCLGWVTVHALVGVLLGVSGAGRNGRGLTYYVVWGAVVFLVQAPILLSWLRAWKAIPPWLISGGVLFGVAFVFYYPFATGLSYAFCTRVFVPACAPYALLLVQIPVGITVGVLQWLLGRRVAKHTAWLIPAQVAGVAAFSLVFVAASSRPASGIFDTFPVVVVAGVAYALVVALALPRLRPR